MPDTKETLAATLYQNDDITDGQRALVRGDGPDGEAFVGLGLPPDPQMVRLINIVIGAPVEALDDGRGDDRIFRIGPAGALRFGFGDGVDLYPGDACGVELSGGLRLALSSSAGRWIVRGEVTNVSDESTVVLSFRVNSHGYARGGLPAQSAVRPLQP